MTEFVVGTTTTIAAAVPTPMWAVSAVVLGILFLTGGFVAALLYFQNWLKKPIGLVIEDDNNAHLERVSIDAKFIRWKDHAWSMTEDKKGKGKTAQERDHFSTLFETKQKVPIYFLPTDTTEPLSYSRQGFVATSETSESLAAKLESKLATELAKLSLTDILNAPNWAQLMAGALLGVLLMFVAKKFGFGL